MTRPRCGSLFSGVGGFDLGLERAGFETAFLCERDEWKRNVLEHYWPDTPIHPDVCEFEPSHDERNIHVLVGGFPCQDLSVAGARAGLAGARSGLAFEFLRVADRIRPRWIILENVPGLLSSNRGRDMAVLLDALADLRYGWAYRVLDAQHFGVPQRRRRVFIVARRADAELGATGASRAALRVVWEGGEGDPTPGWPPQPIVASLVEGAARADRCGRSLNTVDSLAPNLSPTVTTKWGTTGSGGPAGSETQNLVAERAGEVFPPDAITAGFHSTGGGSHGLSYSPDLAPTIKVGSSGGLAPPAVVIDTTMTKGAAYRGIRKLTELECERLMGWPDHFTAPPSVRASRSRRVAACGDGVVSWVVYWLGRRILLVDGLDVPPRRSPAEDRVVAP